LRSAPKAMMAFAADSTTARAVASVRSRPLATADLGPTTS
jgi:hypothetical protein